MVTIDKSWRIWPDVEFVQFFPMWVRLNMYDEFDARILKMNMDNEFGARTLLNMIFWMNSWKYTRMAHLRKNGLGKKSHRNPLHGFGWSLHISLRIAGRFFPEGSSFACLQGSLGRMSAIHHFFAMRRLPQKKNLREKDICGKRYCNGLSTSVLFHSVNDVIIVNGLANILAFESTSYMRRKRKRQKPS